MPNATQTSAGNTPQSQSTTTATTKSAKSATPTLKKNTLFREQALNARSGNTLGSIRIDQPLRFHIAAGVAMLMLVVLAAFLILGHYTKKATVNGVLQPASGALRVSSPAAGALLETRLVEGQVVQAGQPLFVVSTERVSDAGSTQDLVALQLKQRTAVLEQDASGSSNRAQERLLKHTARLQAIASELRQLEQDKALANQRIELARSTLDKYNQLVQAGYVSAVQAQAKQEELINAQSALQNISHTQSSLEREQINTKLQINEAQMQFATEQNDAKRAKALLEQERIENEARRKTVINAPFTGVITGITAQSGQIVGAGQPLATLVPVNQPLDADFFVPTRQAGFVLEGQVVNLRFAAYPYQKFGMGKGVVAEVTRSPYAPQELPTAVLASLGITTGGAEPLYRVRVKLDQQFINAYGKPQPFKPGMLVEGDIMQDNRRIYEWVFEPILSFKQKMS